MAAENMAVMEAPDVPYRQVERPNHASASYVGDDADDHDFRVDARGKSKLNVVVNNATDKTLSTQVYGAPTKTAEVGAAGVEEIGASFDALTGVAGNQQSTTYYPFYLIRCSLAAGPDGATVNLWAFLASN